MKNGQFDSQYKKWLRQTKKIFLSPSDVQGFVNRYFNFVETRGVQAHVANILGIHENMVYSLTKSPKQVSDKIIDRMAIHMQSVDRVNDFMPPIGNPNWCSDDVSYCGENHPEINVSGCGTFFHPHYADGLCKECFENKNNADFVPRDVRLAEKNAE